MAEKKINDIRGKSVPMETVDEEPAEDIAIPDAITTRSQEPQETAETAMPSNINDIRGKMIKTVPMELSGEGEYLEKEIFEEAHQPPLAR